MWFVFITESYRDSCNHFYKNNEKNVTKKFKKKKKHSQTLKAFFQINSRATIQLSVCSTRVVTFAFS